MQFLRAIWEWVVNTIWPQTEQDHVPSDNHRDALCAWHATYQSQAPLEDKFPPTLAASDGRLISKLISPALSYYLTERVFIKRQPYPSELGEDIYDNPRVNPCIADRLRNEAAALRYRRAKTTIPVPEVVDLQTENGLVYIKMCWIDGGVELPNLPTEKMEAAVAAVSSQLESEVLPQLGNLRSRRMGSADADLAIIPPRRFWQWEGRQKVAGD